MKLDATTRRMDTSSAKAYTKGRELSHWRGFTKYQHEDGKCFGVFLGDASSIVLGPCQSGADVDRLISQFYS